MGRPVGEIQGEVVGWVNGLHAAGFRWQVFRIRFRFAGTIEIQVIQIKKID